MPMWLRILLAILIFAFLIAVFIVSFILYRKTPVPKGCEDMGPSEEKCSNCKVEGCRLNIYRTENKKEEKEDDNK